MSIELRHLRTWSTAGNKWVPGIMGFMLFKCFPRFLRPNQTPARDYTVTFPNSCGLSIPGPAPPNHSLD